MKKAYLAGGCFWCICDYLLSLNYEGIKDIIVGYCGGDEKEATYELVKKQQTKHRETIEISYDEETITLPTILKEFTDYVDISDPNGQYIDKGYSYTLAFYYQNEEEKMIFENHLKTLIEPVYITIEPFKFFVKAEEYHQHYGIKNPDKMLEELIASNRSCHLKLKNKSH